MPVRPKPIYLLAEITQAPEGRPRSEGLILEVGNSWILSFVKRVEGEPIRGDVAVWSVNDIEYDELGTSVAIRWKNVNRATRYACTASGWG